MHKAMAICLRLPKPKPNLTTRCVQPILDSPERTAGFCLGADRMEDVSAAQGRKWSPAPGAGTLYTHPRSMQWELACQEEKTDKLVEFLVKRKGKVRRLEEQLSRSTKRMSDLECLLRASEGTVRDRKRELKQLKRKLELQERQSKIKIQQLERAVKHKEPHSAQRTDCFSDGENIPEAVKGSPMLPAPEAEQCLHVLEKTEQTDIALRKQLQSENQQLSDELLVAKQELEDCRAGKDTSEHFRRLAKELESQLDEARTQLRAAQAKNDELTKNRAVADLRLEIAGNPDHDKHMVKALSEQLHQQKEAVKEAEDIKRKWENLQVLKERLRSQEERADRATKQLEEARMLTFQATKLQEENKLWMQQAQELVGATNPEELANCLNAVRRESEQQMEQIIAKGKEVGMLRARLEGEARNARQLVSERDKLAARLAAATAELGKLKEGPGSDLQPAQAGPST
eukprot:evm.model.scf_194.5 EVM.evm.TU.scf_194.5   scf_194:27521-38782(-)